MGPDRPRVGVSRCLLGESVRYDGGHKADRYLLDVLANEVAFVPICPEVEAGMGVPREAAHLVASRDGVPAGSEHVRFVGVRSRNDWTSTIARWSARRASTLAELGLSGYILKKDSPSCGLDRVRVSHARKPMTRTGRGLFAEALVRAAPSLPVEEEGRLHDATLRENFVERIFAFDRVRRFFDERWTVGGLVSLHTAHKLQVLSHSRSMHTELGRLVALAGTDSRSEVAGRYLSTFMRALGAPATPGRHADVMQHMLGHLKRFIGSADREELLELISDYRARAVPLIVPLTLFRHYVRVHRVGCLAGQTYLEPCPRELALRNHVRRPSL